LGYFTIEFASGIGQATEIIILDALGRQVFSQSVTHPLKEEIDFSGFARGTYFVRLQTEKASFVRRMVKQ
jgi:hypothetical protein